MRELTIPILGTRLRIKGRDTSSVDFYPELRGRLIRGDGAKLTSYRRRSPSVLNLGRLSQRFWRDELIDGPNGALLSRMVVTDAGVAHLVSQWMGGTENIANFNVHANGAGTTAEAVTNTALVTEHETRVAGLKTSPNPNQMRTVATINQTGTQAITEHGLFNSTTVAGSILWDRSVFSAINVQNGDAIEFTYTLTVNAGG